MRDADSTARVLSAILSSRGQPGEVFSYYHDFGKLWSPLFNFTSKLPQTREGALFIVWDDVPAAVLNNVPSAFAFGTFLTIYDWAAAVTLAVDSRQGAFGESASPPDVHVYVLDVTDHKLWKDTYGFKLRSIMQTLAPWLTVLPLGRASVRTFLAHLTDGAPQRTTLQDHAQTIGFEDSARLVRSLWQAELTRAGGRHSVSNAIGPVALAAGMQKYKGSDDLLRAVGWRRGNEGEVSGSIDCFWRWLELLDLVPSLSEEAIARTATPRLGNLEKDQPFRANLWGRFSKVRCLLVDDLAGYGFHSVLSFLIAGSAEITARKSTIASVARGFVAASSDGPYTLESYANSLVLMEWIDALGAARDKSLPRRPQIFGKGGAGGVPELPQFDILFLDLRLFHEGSAAAEAAEKARLERLIGSYSRFVAGASARHMSMRRKQALEEAVKAAKDYCDKKYPFLASFKHFALLPLMISAMDPTMPIILFSSTRQREVIELFDSYPNIITTFAKPVVSGYSDNVRVIERSAAELREALRRALLLHEARIIWEMLEVTPLEGLVSPAHWFRFGEHGGWNVRRCTPYMNEEKHVQSFIDFFIDSVVGGRVYDALFRPYDILESALLANEKDPADCNIGFLRFSAKQPDGSRPLLPFDFARLTVEENDRDLERVIMCFCQHMKNMRNSFAHGAFVERNEDDENVRLAGILMCLMFVLCLDRNRLEKMFDNAIGGQVQNFSIALDQLLFRPAVRPSVTTGFVVDLRNKLKEWARFGRDRSVRAFPTSNRKRP